MAFAASPLLRGEDIKIELDLTRPGVVADRVVKRSLFFAGRDNPVHLGPVGIGSFSEKGTVVLPFDVQTGGDFKLVLTYGLTKNNRPIAAKIDGSIPHESWQNVTQWPSTPDYLWGSSLYDDYWKTDCSSKHLVCWTLSNTPVALTPGAHAIEMEFPEGEILITELLLTTGDVPVNSPEPWTFDSYVPFPALDFISRTIEPLGEKLRITFHGQWQNLAPHPVSFQITTSVMPRKGRSQPVYQVTDVQPADRLSLDVGQAVPFSLTVESTEPVPDKYSEIIQLNLSSLDVPNLFKPYLMSAANGYLEVKRGLRFRYVKGYNDFDLGVGDGTDPKSVIPTRETLDFLAGYPKRGLHEAFVLALANASEPVGSAARWPWGIVNYTAWARSGAGRCCNSETVVPRRLIGLGG